MSKKAFIYIYKSKLTFLFYDPQEQFKTVYIQTSETILGNDKYILSETRDGT